MKCVVGSYGLKPHTAYGSWTASRSRGIGSTDHSMWSDELKKIGNDGCYRAIMNWLEENPGWCNEDALGTKGFRYLLKGKRQYVNYSPQTVGRKARALYQMGFIEKGHDDRGHTRYRLPESPKTVLRGVNRHEARVVGVWSELDPWTGLPNGITHDIYE